MKKRLVVLGALLSVFAAGSGTAQALHGGLELLADGHGTFGAGVADFSFSARMSEHEFTDPLGEPHGRMKLVLSFGGVVREFTAEVTCMTVVGRAAMIGGKITRFKSSDGLDFPDRGLLFDVLDTTLVGGSQPVPDAIAIGTTLDPPQVCPPPGVGLARAPLEEGEITVEQK